MFDQSVHGPQSILIQSIATTSDTDDTTQPDQRHRPDRNEGDARLATELEIDGEAVLFRPRLQFVSED